MSGISVEQVAHVAELARLDLPEGELETYAAELDVIIRSVAEVNDAPIKDVEPTSHPLPLTNVFREDVPSGMLSNEQALASAPDAEDGQFKVPAILEAE